MNLKNSYFLAQDCLSNCGQALFNIRKHLGYSRQQTADLSRLHVNTIGHIERGSKDVNIITQTRLFAAFGCTAVKIVPGNISLDCDFNSMEQIRSQLLSIPNPQIISLIGSAIRKIRSELGCSIKEIAKKANIHPNSLWNIENGLVICSFLTLYRIYSSLGVSRIYLSNTGITLE